MMHCKPRVQTKKKHGGRLVSALYCLDLSNLTRIWVCKAKYVHRYSEVEGRGSWKCCKDCGEYASGKWEGSTLLLAVAISNNSKLTCQVIYSLDVRQVSHNYDDNQEFWKQETIKMDQMYQSQPREVNFLDKHWIELNYFCFLKATGWLIFIDGSETRNHWLSIAYVFMKGVDDAACFVAVITGMCSWK